MELNFEQTLEEIEKIVQGLENGTLGLDESIISYEKGMKHINECSEKLLAAEKRLKIIEKDINGNLTEVPFCEHKKEDGSETIDEFKEKTDFPKKKKIKTEKEKNNSQEKDKDLELELF